jgi:hypothetical protein
MGTILCDYIKQQKVYGSLQDTVHFPVTFLKITIAKLHNKTQNTQEHTQKNNMRKRRSRAKH